MVAPRYLRNKCIKNCKITQIYNFGTDKKEVKYIIYLCTYTLDSEENPKCIRSFVKLWIEVHLFVTFASIV